MPVMRYQMQRAICRMWTVVRGHAAPGSRQNSFVHIVLSQRVVSMVNPSRSGTVCLGKAYTMRDRVLLRSLMLAVVMVLFVTACSSDEPAAGPVTFETEVDFSFRPVTGTFEVTEGADVLGCSSGAFVDSGTPTDGIQRVFTCDSGSSEGSFTTSFNFDTTGLSNNDSDNGTWSVVEGSDDFDGLQGSGDWSIVYDQTGGGGGVGTWTGDINYTS